MVSSWLELSPEARDLFDVVNYPQSCVLKCANDEVEKSYLGNGRCGIET